MVDKDKLKGKTITVQQGNKNIHMSFGQQPPKDMLRNSARKKARKEAGEKLDLHRLGPGDLQKYREGWDRIFGKKK